LDIGDSATGESLLSSESCLSSSSSSGVGSLVPIVSKEVCEEIESRMFDEAREVARETVLKDVLGLITAFLGDSLGWSMRPGLNLCVAALDGFW